MKCAVQEKNEVRERERMVSDGSRRGWINSREIGKIRIRQQIEPVG
jgi:hypothetical protein